MSQFTVKTTISWLRRIQLSHYGLRSTYFLVYCTFDTPRMSLRRVIALVMLHSRCYSDPTVLFRILSSTEAIILIPVITRGFSIRNTWTIRWKLFPQLFGKVQSFHVRKRNISPFDAVSWRAETVEVNIVIPYELRISKIHAYETSSCLLIRCSGRYLCHNPGNDPRRSSTVFTSVVEW